MADDRRNPKYSPYRQAQLDARARQNALTAESLQRIDVALAAFASELSATLVGLGDTSTDLLRRAAVTKALVILQGTLQPRLTYLLAGAVTGQRAAAFSDILELQNQASLAVAAAHEIPNNLLGGITAPAVTMAGAWESLGTGAATWKTLLARYAGDAVKDVQQIVTTALLSGMGPDELAKRLRPYVQGAEPFQQAFANTGEIKDKLLNNPAFKRSAALLRYNADRIAFSETQNARGEAETQAFAADPFIAAVKWTLSPNRGTQRWPDACNGLAETDFYGLGAGVYPVDKVPFSPHPFCLHPDAEVSGNITNAMRSEYAGEVITIMLHNGRELTITPQHPVLTPRGWVRAQDIQNGDELLCDTRYVERAVGQNIHHVPPTARECFDAAWETGQRSRLQATSEHLHGEAVRRDRQIDVVHVHPMLLRHHASRESQRVSEWILEAALIDAVLGNGFGAATLCFVGLPPTRQGGVGRAYDILPLLRAALVPDVLVGKGHGNFQPAIAQDLGDVVAADADFFRNTLGARAPFVAVEHVLDVHRGQYEGHVYDFSCEDGLIITGSVIVSNCRCERVPIARQPEDVGKPKPSPARDPHVAVRGVGCGD